MQLFVVAVRDIKTNLFGQPMTIVALGAAIRSFEDQIKNPPDGRGDATLRAHPEDFELYQLGTYDDNTGEFTNNKVQIAVGSNYRT